MAPRGKKKAAVSSPKKPSEVKQSPSQAKKENAKKRKGAKDEEEVVDITSETSSAVKSPRKRARRGAANGEVANNNNNEKEVEEVTNNNNNNNNEKGKKKGANNAASGTRKTRRAKVEKVEVIEMDDDAEEEADDEEDDVQDITEEGENEDDGDDEVQIAEENCDGEFIGPDTLPVTSPEPAGSDDSRDGISIISNDPSHANAKILQATPPQPKENKNTFKCKVCDQWFPNRYFQRKHMLMEHENQLYECRVCSFNSVNPEKLKSHIIKQHVIKKERTEPVSIDEIKVDLDELITKHTPRKVVMEDGVALGRDSSNKMRYICAMCERIYTSKYSLERHVRCHTGEKPYVCDVCNFSTSYREHMMRHMTSVHLIVHSDEPKPKYVPKNRRRTEEKNVSTDDPDVMVIEDGQTAENGNAADGEKAGDDGKAEEEGQDGEGSGQGKKRRNILRKRFECAACGLKATHKTDLVNHIKDKHPNAHIESLDNGDGSKVHLIVTMSKKPAPSRRMVITCSDCSKVFHDTWKYKVHMRSHTGVKPFGCSICSFFATSKMTVRDHIHRRHKDVENPRILLRTVGIDGTVSHVELSMPQREFKCDHCDEMFDDNYRMKAHKKKEHTDQAPFSCVECSHREWARANIIIHCLQTHEAKSVEGMILRNNKPFNVGPLKLPSCQQCDKVFPYQSQLYIHMKQHTGERNYFCDMCSYCTNSKASLEKHILKHLEGEQNPKKSTARKRTSRRTPKADKANEEEVVVEEPDDPSPAAPSKEKKKTKK